MGISPTIKDEIETKTTNVVVENKESTPQINKLTTNTATTEFEKNVTQTTTQIPDTTVKTTMPLNDLIKTFYAQTVLNNTTEAPKNYTRIPVTTVKPMLNKTTTVKPLETTITVIDRFAVPMMDAKPPSFNYEISKPSTQKPHSSSTDMSMDVDMMSEINQFIANALETIDVENLQTEKYKPPMTILDNDKNIMKEAATLASSLLDDKEKIPSQITSQWKEIYSTSSENYKESPTLKPTQPIEVKEVYEIVSMKNETKPEHFVYNTSKEVLGQKITTASSIIPISVFKTSSVTATNYSTNTAVTKPVTVFIVNTTEGSTTVKPRTTAQTTTLKPTVRPSSTTLGVLNTTNQLQNSFGNKFKVSFYILDSF